MAHASFFSLANLKKLFERKEVAAGLVIIVISLFFAADVYKKQKRKILQLQNSIDKEEQKISVSNEVKGLNKKRAQMSEPFIKNSSSLSADTINKFAMAAKVKVLLLDPMAEQDMGIYVISSFKMELKANFSGIAKFVSILESQPAIIKIEEVSLQKEEASSLEADKNRKKDILKAVLKISEISIKKE